MKVYIKFIIISFLKSFLYVSMIFFSLVVAMNFFRNDFFC